MKRTTIISIICIFAIATLNLWANATVHERVSPLASAHTQHETFVLDSIIAYSLRTNEPATREIYEFDYENNRLIRRLYFWQSSEDSGLWLPRVKFIYDTNANNTLYYRYAWSAEQNDWTLTNRYIFEIDYKSNSILYVFQVLDSGNWIESSTGISRIRFDYHPIENPITFTVSYLHRELNAWIPWNLRVTYHNAGRRKTHYAYGRHPSIRNQWQVNSRGRYEWYDNRIISALRYTREENEDTAFWKPLSLSRYYYSLRVIENIFPESNFFSEETEGIRIFPNPASDFVAVIGARAGSSLTVFNLSGHIVFRQNNINEEEIVSVLSWITGTYLFVIQSGDEKSVHKILKR